MSEFSKQMVNVLMLLRLCFGGSSAIKFEPWSIFLDLKPDELYYYPFIVSMNMCDKNCNTVEDLFSRTGVPIKTKDVNLKVLILSKH